MKDPLDAVFETPEESLAHFLKQMPPLLIPVFQREFMRRPTKRPLDAGDSAASQAFSPQSGESTPEVKLAATQRK